MYPPLVPDQDALALRTTVRSWNARLKILVGHGSAVSRMRATLVDNECGAERGADVEPPSVVALTVEELVSIVVGYGYGDVRRG
jgi:hypothetical protein